MKSFASLMGADPDNDRLRAFTTSWLLRPYALFGVRALIALYCFTVIFFIFGWNGTHGDNESNRQSFSYFTWLTYWGVAWYFLVAAVQTFTYARNGRSLLDRWPRGLRVLHALFWSTIVTFPWVVLVVYWGILYPGHWYALVFEAWTNISQHAMPPLFSLFEMIFSSVPPMPFLHLAFLIFILLLYLSLAYLTHATQGFYTYSFLDPGAHHEHSGRVAGYCFGVLAAVLVAFVIVWFIVWLRRRLVGSRIKRSQRDMAGHDTAAYRLEGGEMLHEK